MPDLIISKSTLDTLTAQYDAIKATASDATAELTAKATFKGMDNVNEIVATAMAQIREFTDNGKQSSFADKTLAVIDPKNKWAGKWLGAAKTTITEETLKETTIEEIANKVISSINSQREDVVTYMESIVSLRTVLDSNREHYSTLLDKANALLPTIPVDTREELDTKALINKLVKSLMQVESTVFNKINPLVASARLAIGEIDGQLPDIEHDLKYDGSLKIAQQALADYIGMAKTVKDMTEKAGDAIRKDIHETTLESINMVGEVMVDTDRLRQLQKEEATHMHNVNKAMSSTRDKINQNFNDINQIQLEYTATKKETSNVMLEHYADVK